MTAAAAAIVVAAGRGDRLGQEVPKAFIELAGEPLLLHAVRRLVAAGIEEVHVVVPDGEEARARALMETAGLSGLGKTVAGGATRAASVRAGLAVADRAAVAVHDAARPLASADLIERTIEALEPPWVAVAPALPVVDTLKWVDDEGAVHTAERAGLYAVQTPQVFVREALVQAHDDPDPDPNDDLMLVERRGGRVRLIPGERRNFKITFPEDLALAAALLGAGP